MTVSVPTQLEFVSNGDGVTASFPYPVRFLDKTEMYVAFRVNEVDTVKILGVDYNISGTSWPTGGNVVFTVAPPSGVQVVRRRETAAKQVVDLEDKTRNPAQAVEDQLDRMTMVDQDRGGAIAGFVTGLKQEIENRIEADNALSGDISDLADDIANETSERIAGDAALAALIDGGAGMSDPAVVFEFLGAGEAGKSIFQTETAAEVVRYLGGFGTASELAASFIHPSVKNIRTDGWAVLDDGGAANYRRLDEGEPAAFGDITSLLGGRWRVMGDKLRPAMFGLFPLTAPLSALQSFFDFASGKTVLMPLNGVFDIGGGTLTINGNNTLIKWRGCTIRRSVNAETFGLMAMGNNVQFKGVMKYRCVDGDIQRGVAIGGHDFTADTIDIEADAAGTGNGNHRRDALCVGSQAYVVYRSKFRRVRIKNFEFAANARNAVDVDFGYLDIEVFRRGLYIDESSFIRATGYMRTGSPLNTGSAGENGVLVHSEATTISEHIYIRDMVVEGNGEHGFRVAGTFAARNIWFTNCTSRKAGRAGFKSLGIETTDQSNIFYDSCIVEDCGFLLSNENACGFQIEYTSNVQINNCIVRRKIASRSSFDGIRITGCLDVQINNPMISWAAEDGIRVDSSRGVSNRIRVNGGTVVSNGRHGIFVSMATGLTFRDIDFVGRILVHDSNKGGAGGYDFFAENSGSFPVGGVIELQLKNTTVVTANSGILGGNLSDWTLNAIGPYPAVAPVGVVRNGSMWQNPGGTLKIKKAGSWVDL